MFESTTPPLRLTLVGLGSAGRSRLKALAATPGLQLAGLVSRRAELATISWEEALRSPQIDAIAISTENTDHAARARQALLADKHVLLDYPIATAPGEAEALYELAAQRDRLLHVEHIGLLAPDHVELKSQAAKMGTLLKGEFLFQGGWSEKLEDAKYSGPLPLLVLPRLLQMADLFGSFDIEASQLRRYSPGFSLHLHLRFGDGGGLDFTEERIPNLPRRRSLLAQGKNDSIAWRSGTLTGGLFARDLACFRDRIVSGAKGYYDENRMLRVLNLLIQGKINMQSP